MKRIIDGFDRTGDEIAFSCSEKLPLIFDACRAFADIICRRRAVLFIVDTSAHFRALNFGVDEFIERPLRVVEPYEKKIREGKEKHRENGDDYKQVAGN